MNTTADSLASGALGLAVAALAWLVTHSAQIKRLLEMLPGVAADAAKAKAAVDVGGIGAAVTATLSPESEAMLRGLLAKLEAQVAPMAEPTTGGTAESGPSAVDQAPAAADSSAQATAPAPAAAGSAVPAPSGLPEGTTYTVRDGQLVPASS